MQKPIIIKQAEPVEPTVKFLQEFFREVLLLKAERKRDPDNKKVPHTALLPLPILKPEKLRIGSGTGKCEESKIH